VAWRRHLPPHSIVNRSNGVVETGLTKSTGGYPGVSATSIANGTPHDSLSSRRSALASTISTWCSESHSEPSNAPTEQGPCELSAPEQADQCSGPTRSSVGWSDLVERYVSVCRYLNDTPPLWELDHGAFKVTGRDHGRAPVEDTAVCRDLARKARRVSRSVLISKPRSSRPMRARSARSCDWGPRTRRLGQRVLLGGEEVLSERRPHGMLRRSWALAGGHLATDQHPRTGPSCRECCGLGTNPGPAAESTFLSERTFVN